MVDRTSEYKKIGLDGGLVGARLDLYVNFMMKGFDHMVSVDYAREWAHRFYQRTEFMNADAKHQEILKHFYHQRKYKHIAFDTAATMMDPWYGWKNADEIIGIR